MCAQGKGHVTTQQEGGCLQARKKGLTKTSPLTYTHWWWLYQVFSTQVSVDYSIMSYSCARLKHLPWWGAQRWSHLRQVRLPSQLQFFHCQTSSAWIVEFVAYPSSSWIQIKGKCHNSWMGQKFLRNKYSFENEKQSQIWNSTLLVICNLNSI